MQLLGSVNDFYGYGNNEQYRGKYGIGYIDATKAMNMGDGEAPSAVTDLDLQAAQDYIMASWTIPASSDNVVASHIIYYSTAPFTASSDLSTLSSAIIDTRFSASGDRYEYEISNLNALTDYYVAIKAVNRFGRESALSDVKHIRTNAGPEMTLSETSVSMSSSASDPVASASVNIGNNAEGLLKWSTKTSTLPANPAMYSLERPNSPGNAGAYKGSVSGKKLKANARVTDDYEASDYPKFLTYQTELYAYIGDEDRTLPNSMAQWLRVDPDVYPNGFNVTDLVIEGYYGKDPTIEIYRGETGISSATLLQRVTYDYYANGYPVALKKQLNLAPGQSIWVVVHYDGNQEGYPLSLCYSDTQGCGQYSYMSNDKGHTWTQLPAALAGSPYAENADNLTWGIRARSSNPDWSQVLELNPSEGTVAQGETQKVDISANGSKIVNGSYKFDVTFETNESENPEKNLEVNYTVDGNKPNVQMPKVVDFGSLLVGQSKTLTVESYNAGYGSFRGTQWGAALYQDNISSSSEHFKGPESVQSGFPARSRTSFDVTYCPQNAGSHTGTITFTDVNGEKVRLILQGAATEPAKIKVEPAVVDAGTLTVGEEPVTKTFTISNVGKYPLEYVMPKFSNETIEGSTKATHKFGYNVFANIDGYPTYSYDNNPALTNATNIASSFNDETVLSEPISLGFTFPYYGKNYDRVYITSYGALIFNQPTANFWPPLTPESASVAGTGMIAAYGQQLQIGPDTRIEYAKADGKFVVKYKDVLCTVYGDELTPISFHLTLSSNGDIEIFYDNYDHEVVFQNGSGLFCGINDPEVEDPVTLTSADMADFWGTREPSDDSTRFTKFGTGTAVLFQAPKASFIRAIDKAAGIVTPGETVEVTATLSADAEMNAGESFNTIAIVTNDPNPEVCAVRINAVIAGDELVPLARLEKESYDAGDVFRTATVQIPVTLRNDGHSDLQVNSIALAYSRMTVSPNEAFTLGAGLAKDLVVTVPTDAEGAVQDVLNVATSAGNVSATVKANVIGCPQAGLSIESVNETVESGTPLSRDLVVTNNGNETLRYSVVPDALVRLTTPENPDAVTTYQYVASVDDASADTPWVDIETNGLGEHHPLSYYMLHDYVAVDLPFEFTFYGKKYSRMYVYNSGFISFTQRRDDKIWPEPPTEFPQGTLYTNIIAPYWGLHSMDQTKTAGTYHYVTDDRAVVSFMEYGNSMNIGVDFQCIINKDGTFSFRYKADNADAVIYDTFGLAGIASESGEQSIQLPSRYVMFDNSVRFNPVIESPVAPGKSETVKLDFDTKRMAGSYGSTLRVNTNQPQRERIDIPVNLEITGQADILWPEDINVEHTVGYVDTDYSNPIIQMGALYSADFTVKNQGTADYTIANISVGGPTIVDEWFGDEVPVFNLFYYAPEIDWITGEPSGNYVWQPYSPGMPVTVSSEPVKFALPMLNPEFANTPGETPVPITFTDLEGNDHVVTVTYLVTPPPAMTLDKQESYVKVENEDQMVAESLTIGNEGEYKLNYTIELDPSGIGAQEPGQGGDDPGVDPLSKKPALTDIQKAEIFKGIVPADRNENAMDCPQNFEFRDAIFYPAVPGTNKFYNYGADNLYDVFKTATTFKAPAEGFNLSHFYAPLFNDALPQGCTLKIEVVQGSDPAGEVVLGSSSYTTSDYNPQQTVLNVMKLDRPIFLNPNEEFTVIVTYPAGMAHPSLLVAKEEAVVSGRYMAYRQDYGWYDAGELFEENYGSLGYINTCLETSEGHPWIALTADSQTTNTIQVGENATVKFDINPAAARMEKANKAVLIIRSNDPNQPVVNYPIILDKNGAPVIEAPENTLYAQEGAETEVTVRVSDPDLDNYSIFISGLEDHATVKSVVPDAADTATVTPTDNGYEVSGATMPVTVTVALNPDYGTASDAHSFSLTALDDKGKYAEATVRYAIEHVNRAPVALDDIETVTVAKGATSNVVSFASLFTEPDGEEMTFTFSMPSNRYAEAYTTDSGVIFFGKAIGEVQVSVTAADPAGLATVKTFTVKVDKDDAIEEITDATNARGLLTVTPNPVVDNINARCNFDAQKARIRLFTSNGQLVRESTRDIAAGQTVVLPADNLAAGIYLLTIETAQRTYTARIIKK